MRSSNIIQQLGVAMAVAGLSSNGFGSSLHGMLNTWRPSWEKRQGQDAEFYILRAKQKQEHKNAPRLRNAHNGAARRIGR